MSSSHTWGKRMLALLLVLLCLPVASFAKEHDYRVTNFALHFVAGEDVPAPVGDLLDMLQLEGEVAVYKTYFDMHAAAQLGQAANTRNTFHLWGMPARAAL